MAFTICAFNHREWARYNLANFEDFADMISECNQGEDAFSGFGEWFYVPDERLANNDAVIYFGTWGNDHSPGDIVVHARRNLRHERRCGCGRLRQAGPGMGKPARVEGSPRGG